MPYPPAPPQPPLFSNSSFPGPTSNPPPQGNRSSFQTSRPPVEQFANMQVDSNTQRARTSHLEERLAQVEKVLTKYEGVTLRKDTHPPHNAEPSWARVKETPLAASYEELIKIVKKRGKDNAQKDLQRLKSEKQRAQIEELLDEKRRLERNESAEWSLVMVDEERGPGRRSNETETKALHVILKRHPKVSPAKDGLIRRASVPTPEIPGVVRDLNRPKRLGADHGPIEGQSHQNQQQFEKGPLPGPPQVPAPGPSHFAPSGPPQGPLAGPPQGFERGPPPNLQQGPMPSMTNQFKNIAPRPAPNQPVRSSTSNLMQTPTKQSFPPSLPHQQEQYQIPYHHMPQAPNAPSGPLRTPAGPAFGANSQNMPPVQMHSVAPPQPKQVLKPMPQAPTQAPPQVPAPPPISVPTQKQRFQQSELVKEDDSDDALFEDFETSAPRRNRSNERSRTKDGLKGSSKRRSSTTKGSSVSFTTNSSDDENSSHWSRVSEDFTNITTPTSASGSVDRNSKQRNSTRNRRQSSTDYVDDVREPKSNRRQSSSTQTNRDSQAFSDDMIEDYVDLGSRNNRSKLQDAGPRPNSRSPPREFRERAVNDALNKPTRRPTASEVLEEQYLNCLEELKREEDALLEQTLRQKEQYERERERRHYSPSYFERTLDQSPPRSGRRY